MSVRKKMLMLLLPLLMAACNSSQDKVLSSEKMALLLADIHTAESVSDLNRSEFPNDSVRQLLKQSVYARHGVTQRQVDTSFVWYGHHLGEYIKVYDRVAEILKERMDAIDEDMVDVAMSVVGDSADAWGSARSRVFDLRYPENYLSFTIDADDTWKNGDVYEWKAKVFNTRAPLQWSMVVDYDTDTREMVADVTEGDEGWHTLTLPLDSTRTAVRVYGFASLPLMLRDHVYVDSISLVRTRVENAGYWNRRRKVKRLDESLNP